MAEIFLPEPSPSPECRRPPASTGTPSPVASPPNPGALDLDLGQTALPVRLGSKRTNDALDSDDEAEDHSQLIQSLTKQQDLNTNSTLELERFSRLRLPQQLIMLHATVLAVKESSAAQSGAAAWAIPTELEASIGKYAMAFVYSANCRAYKKQASGTVLAAMRAGKVVLPPDSDVGRLEKVHKRINDKLTDYRSEMKRKIKDSIAAGTDIATLAAEVVNGSGVQLTVEFYHRLAWLRCFGPVVSFDQKNFWNLIDEVLDKARNQFPDNKYAAHFKSIYRKDIDKFGPASSGVVAIASATVPDHQRIVEKTASEIATAARKRSCVQRKTAAPVASSSATTPAPE